MTMPPNDPRDWFNPPWPRCPVCGELVEWTQEEHEPKVQHLCEPPTGLEPGQVRTTYGPCACTVVV